MSNEVKSAIIYRDGEEIGRVGENPLDREGQPISVEGAVLALFHRYVGYSMDHAIKHEGYSVVYEERSQNLKLVMNGHRLAREMHDDPILQQFAAEFNSPEQKLETHRLEADVETGGTGITTHSLVANQLLQLDTPARRERALEDAHRRARILGDPLSVAVSHAVSEMLLLVRMNDESQELWGEEYRRVELLALADEAEAGDYTIAAVAADESISVIAQVTKTDIS
jgi:hypothetical protein